MNHIGEGGWDGSDSGAAENPANVSVTVGKKYKGKLESGEIGLPMENSDLILPCGIYGRWEN